MKGPQCDDGFTRIANELLEALCRYRISGESMQVFLTILRKTYGFGKKMDLISLTQFVEATGIPKPNVVRALRQLESLQVITVTRDGGNNRIGINKNYKGWIVEKRTIIRPVIKNDNAIIKNDNVVNIDNGIAEPTESITETTLNVIENDNAQPLSKTITSVIKTDNESLSKTIPTKEIKETITKEIKPIPPVVPQGDDLLFEEFWKGYPRKVGKGAAEKAWKKIRAPAQTLPFILEALAWQKNSDQWRRNNGEYIPHPSTYLNQRRWEDERPDSDIQVDPRFKDW